MSNIDFTDAIDATVNGAVSQGALAPNGSPERAAKALSLEARSGIPAPVIDLNIEKAAAEIEQQERAAVVRGSPAIQNYIASNPMAAKVSSDDFSALDQAWQTVKNLNPVFSLFPNPANVAEGLFVGPQEGDPALQREITPFERDAIKRIREGKPGIVDYLALAQYFPRHTMIRMAESLNQAVTMLMRAQADPENFDQIAEAANAAGWVTLGMIPKSSLPKGTVTYTRGGSRRIYPDAEQIEAPKTPQEAAGQTLITLAQDQAAGLDAAMEAVVATKTRERSPQMLQDFLTQNVGDETIGVSAEALKSIYDAEGVVPAPGDPVFGFDPDIAAKLERALATGSDVEVPLASYLARVDPKVHDQLLPMVRSREGLTIEEAKEVADELKTAVDERRGQFIEEEAPNNDRSGPPVMRLRTPDITDDKWGLFFEDSGDHYTVVGAYLAPEQQGQGLAVKMYEELLSKGKPLYSDSTVSPSAVRIYEALERRGYRVEKTEGVTVSENSNDLLGPPLQPVFIVYPKADTDTGIIPTYVSPDVGPVVKDISDQAPVFARKDNASANSDLPMISQDQKLFSVEIGDKTLAVITNMKDKTDLWVQWIGSFTGEPVNFDIGLRAVRSIAKELAKHYPEATHISGNRVTGARQQTGNLTQEQYEAAETVVRMPLRPSIESGVTETKKSLYLDPLFRDPESAGMSAPEFSLYSKKLEDLQAKARAKDLSALERQTTRELTKEWKATVQEEIALAEAEFDTRKDVIAARFIRTGALEPGTGGGEGVPLDVDAAPGLKGLSARGGVNPDEIAGLLGYATGEELVADLGRLVEEQGRKTEAGYRKAITEALALERARERFGDPAERAQQVIDLIADEDVSRVLYDDLRVMQKQGGGEPLNFDEMKAWSEREFAKVSVKEARKLNNALRAVTKNGRAAELFLLKGKLPEAFKAKNQQLMATLWLQQALKFNKQLPKDLKLIKGYTKKKTSRAVDPNYTVQIQKILEMLGIRTRADRGAIQASQPLAVFVQEQNADAGYDVAVSPLLYQPLMTNLDTMSVQDFRDVMDSIRSLNHVGRDLVKVLRKGQKEDLANVLQQINDNLRQLPIVTLDRGLKRDLRGAVSWIDSVFTKPEWMIDDLDLGDPFGPLNETVFTPFTKAEHLEDSLFLETKKRLGGLRIENDSRLVPNDEFFNPMSGDPERGVPYRPYSINRGDLVMMALNFGNKHNRDLLVNTLVPVEVTPETGAAFYAIAKQQAEEQVLAYLNRHMTEKDWAWVEGLWDYFDWVKPQMDALYRRTAGIAPDTVQPLSFDTPFGEKRGGYTPVISDPARSKVTTVKEIALFEQQYHKATTANGFTKARTPGSMEPLLINDAFKVLQNRIRAMLHDLAFREPLLNAQKIIYNKDFRMMVTKHYGAEYADTFHPWMRYIANHFNEEDRMLGLGARWMRGARKNIIITVLGNNLKTIASPNLGPTLLELGMAPTDVGYMLLNWNKFSEEALALSGELRSRMQNSDRDVSDVLRDNIGMSTPRERLRARGAEFGMALVAKIDRILATITFIRTRERAMAAGASAEEATLLGDKAVRKNFGSASPVNLGHAFRQSESTKLLTMFMGYMNFIYNKTRDVVQVSKSGVKKLRAGDRAGARRDFVKVLADSLAFILVPTLFGALYSPPEEDESWGGYLAKLLTLNLAGTLPFAREVTSSVIQGLPARNFPMVQIATGLYDAGEDAWNAVFDPDEVSDKWVKHAITVPGYLLGLPTGQVANSSQYLWNLSNGDDTADTFGEFVRGIVYGTSEPSKR